MWHHCKGDMWHKMMWQGTVALTSVDKWTSYRLTCGSCGKVVRCHVAQSWAATWHPFSGSLVLEKCLEFMGVNPLTYGLGVRLGMFKCKTWQGQASQAALTLVLNLYWHHIYLCLHVISIGRIKGWGLAPASEQIPNDLDI
jgi:hypothetical protein